MDLSIMDETIDATMENNIMKKINKFIIYQIKKLYL